MSEKDQKEQIEVSQAEVEQVAKNEQEIENKQKGQKEKNQGEVIEKENGGGKKKDEEEKKEIREEKKGEKGDDKGEESEEGEGAGEVEGKDGAATEGEEAKEDVKNEVEKEDDADLKSVYVKNVDYSADINSLREHFKGCGGIARVTIICNRLTGQPLGYAYIEFDMIEGVEKAISLYNKSMFKNRQITVMKKRKNLPGRGSRVRRGSRGRRGRRAFNTRFAGFGRGFFAWRPYRRGRNNRY
ncbi:unnamed protein product [Moneuplotes crassus]|uniref:RRM domain-containing protein n=1 Tax=Euplotes crassus TaxID=5936 RepID=A0AAD2D372_EUPCR|nr:unnamed protein product [Moneuplotes crassus]